MASKETVLRLVPGVGRRGLVIRRVVRRRHGARIRRCAASKVVVVFIRYMLDFSCYWSGDSLLGCLL